MIKPILFSSLSGIFLFLLFSCLEPATDTAKMKPNQEMENEVTNTSPPFSYLALGDSYTIGESVSDEGRFPAQLTDSLNNRGRNIDSYDIVATTGWTVNEMLQGIARRTDLKEEYDMVSLLIGVNDQYRGYNIEEYKLTFPKALDKALSFVNNDPKRIVVVSIPDYAYTPFGGGKESISQGIDAYNEVNRKITTERGITYVYITDISRNGLDRPELVASDKLHPSAIQYSLWVKRILEEFPLIMD